MTDLEIAAYVDRGLAPERSDQVEEHLAHCAPCRENVVKTQAIVAQARRRSRLVQPAIIVLAAAAIAIVAVPSLRRSLRPDATMRGDTDVPSLLAYGPLGEVRSGTVRFTWGTARDALSYHISVTRDNGQQVWEQSLTDTTVILPQTVSLKPATTYVWVVDAVSSDGVTRSTGIHEFGIAP